MFYINKVNGDINFDKKNIESQIEVIKLLMNLNQRYNNDFIDTDDDRISIYSTEYRITLSSHIFTFRMEKYNFPSYKKLVDDYHMMDLVEFILMYGKNPVFEKHGHQTQEDLDQIISALLSIQ